MTTKEQAEQDFQDLVVKYPTLEFFVTKEEKFLVGFRDKEAPVVNAEVVAPAPEASAEPTPEPEAVPAPEVPTETPTVDPMNPQGEA